MSQESILQIISANPGIEQSKICLLLGRIDRGGGTAHQISQLLKRKEIKRVSVNAKNGTTFQLFPTKGII